MARPLRLEASGAAYHLIVRGNERKAIFRDDADRERYLGRLAHYRERFDFRLYAYCLMDNHVHLAIERGSVPVSRIILAVQSSYTQWFNRRHGRVGHLFQGRYKAFLVQKQRYFWALLRYIHSNPVKARVVQRAQDYRWSSDHFYRRGEGPSWLDLDEVLRKFATRRSAAVREYRRLMASAEGEDYEDLRVQGQVIKGEEEFAERLLQDAGEERRIRKGLEFQRVAQAVASSAGVSVKDLCAAGRFRQTARLRAICALIARREGAIPVSRAAKFFGRDESTLVRQTLRLENETKTDRGLRDRLRKLASVLG